MPRWLSFPFSLPTGPFFARRPVVSGFRRKIGERLSAKGELPGSMFRVSGALLASESEIRNRGLYLHEKAEAPSSRMDGQERPSVSEKPEWRDRWDMTDAQKDRDGGYQEISHRRRSSPSFHPEKALFHNFSVNPRDSLCGVPIVRLRVIR